MTAPTEPLTPPWAYYRRTGLSEMRPYVPGEDMTGVSVSASDYMLLAGNPDPGGFIARNPKNHADKWYVAQAYFEENLEPADAHARDPAAELRAALAKMSDLVFTIRSAEDELRTLRLAGRFALAGDQLDQERIKRKAWEQLAELAAEHDDPDALRAALAATEGSE